MQSPTEKGPMPAWSSRAGLTLISGQMKQDQQGEDQRGVAVLFSCLRCSTVYRATQYRRSTESEGSHTCTACGAVVRSWSGMYGLKDWKAVNVSREYGSRRPNPGGAHKGRPRSK